MDKISLKTKRFVALLMVCAMVMALFTNLVLRENKAEDVATPTDAAEVKEETYSLTFSAREEDGSEYNHELHKNADLTGVQYAVYKDETCTDETDTFVLSYNGKSYVDTDSNPVLYQSKEDMPGIVSEKRVVLDKGTYYIKQKQFLYNSDHSVTEGKVNRDEEIYTIDLDSDREVKIPVRAESEAEENTGIENSGGEVATENSLTSEPDVATASDAKKLFLDPLKSIALLAQAQTYPVNRKQGYGFGENVISYSFTVDSSLTYGNIGIGLCMEEGKTGPSGQSGTLRKTGNKNITRALYYSPYGPEPWNGWIGKNEASRVMILSCVLDHYYNRGGNGYDGGFGTNISDAQQYINYIETMAYPPTESEIQFTVNNKKKIDTTAAYKSGTTIKTGVVTIKGGDATVSLPSGVSMYVLTTKKGAKYKKCNSGTVVKSGYKMYFTASADKSGTSSIKLTSSTGYDSYMIDYADLQDIGFLGTPKSMSAAINITWKAASYLTLEKSGDSVVSAYARYKFADNNNESAAFAEGKRKGVTFRVENSSGTKVGSFICSWNGKCYANKSGQKIVFASRADYDAYKKAHNDLAYQKIRVPEGTYTAIEKSTAYYFDGSTVQNSGVSIKTAYGITDNAKVSIKTSEGGTFTLTPSDKAVTGAYKMTKKILNDKGQAVLKKGAVYTMYEGSTIVAKFTTQSNTYAKVTYMNSKTYPSLVQVNADNNPVRNGGVKLTGIPVGTYTIKETTTPPGCEAEAKNHNATLEVTGTGERLTYWELSKSNGKAVWTRKTSTSSALNICYIAMDETVGDPVNIYLVKVDSETGKAVTGSAASLENAIFKLEYYEGKQQSEVDAGTAGSPKVWHVKTMYDGRQYSAKFNKNNIAQIDGDSEIPSGDQLASDGTFLLPAGTVVITEETAPDAFLNIDEDNSGYIKITSARGAQKVTGTNSVSLYLDGTNKNYYYGNALTDNAIQIYEPVKRGELEFSKVKLNDDGSTSAMADVVFKITDKATGEYHYVVTDKDGKFSSKETKDNGIENLNKNCEQYEELANGYKQGEINSSYGVWFTGNGDIACEDIDKSVIRADRGSFPYGTYVIEEMRCNANKGYVLADPQKFTIDENNKTASLSLPFENVPYPSLTTLAEHTVKRGDNVELADEVYLKWVKSDAEYTLKSVVMDKATGKATVDDNGKYITAVTPLKTPAGEGKYLPRYDLKGDDAVKFKFASKSMKSEYVVFEYLFEGTDTTELSVIDGVPDTSGAMMDDQNNVIGHADINNEDGSQTFRVISIKTKAFATKTETNRIQATKDTEITDQVEMDGLTKGSKYELRGTMAVVSPSVATSTDAASFTKGDLVKIGGKVLQKSKKFTAGSESEKQDVVFDSFDATPYDGCIVVVYEELYDENGNLLASEKEIDNKNQTIYFVHIQTTTNNNLDPLERMKRYDKDITLPDKVWCTNLQVGETYKLDGTLMIQEENTPVLRSDGTKVTGSTTFVADQENCWKTVMFTYNPVDCGLIGKTTIAFEDLWYKNKKIATHSSITDLPQSNTYPFVKTVLTNKKDGSKVLDDSYEAELVDAVSFGKIVEGEDYVVVDKIHYRSSGKPVMINGKGIEAVKTFKAKSDNGTVNVEYPSFDLEEAGVIKDGNVDDIVAYAYLYLGSVDEVNLIAYEEDLTSEDQTVKVKTSNPSIKTRFHLSGSDDKTFSAGDEVVNLTDTVDCYTLKKQTKYRLESYIINKDTEKAIQKDGSAYKVTKRFKTGKSPDEAVDVDFSFVPSEVDIMRKDGSCADLVCYEYLYEEETNKLVAQHTDLNDGGQTVTPNKPESPELGTTATVNGGKKLTKGAVNTVTDVIDYSNIAAGTKIRKVGKLVNRNTEEVVDTVESYFTPDGKGLVSGTTTMDLSVNVPKKGKGTVTYVVLEYFYDAETGELIAKHEDLDSTSQSVWVTYDHTPNTGDNSPIKAALYIFGGTVAIVAVIFIVRFRRRKKKE